MSPPGITAGICLMAGAALETGARLYFRRRFLMPFRSRRIGEYPYDRFIEKAPPPLFFRFKKAFSSPRLTINRLGMRGPEPAAGGLKDRIMVIGESMFFGSKLPRQRDLWSYRLQERLNRAGHTRWEVLNAGVAGYNAVQYKAWWREKLRAASPRILILQMGGNDMTQAYVMGSRWERGAPWPWDFIMRQQRKSPWWNGPAALSCAYFLWRRRKLTERKGFEAADQTFKYDECLRSVEEEAGSIIEEARAMGIRVALTSFSPAYHPDDLENPPPQLEAIQSNWRENMETSGIHLIRLGRWWLDRFSVQAGCPAIDLMKAFWSHPLRFRMYLDVFHWNDKGHDLAASVIFREIEALGWWE